MNSKPEGLAGFLNPSSAFAQLSLRDLLEARDLNHAFLMSHPNVVATAVGRYRIRKSERWPGPHQAGKETSGGVRTLEDSEVRPYSCPAILVFVKEWATMADLAGTPNGALPSALCLPDERSVPVCVIEAPKQLETPTEAINIRYPLNNIGGGNPIVVTLQGNSYAATIACLVSDGHKVYALTNRHVTGDGGEVISSRLDGALQPIGTSSGKQLGRMEFSQLYPDWPGRTTYVNLDVGLIEIDDLDRWTATVGDAGEEIGPMVDLSIANYMSLLGGHVRGTGAATGEMRGEVQALFYRYRTRAGFDYVADLLIGPRSADHAAGRGKAAPFSTHPGDSGTLWLLEPHTPPAKGGEKPAPLPLAVQWGRNMLFSAGKVPPQSYVLATLLAKVCDELEVDPVRNWNLDVADTWGALGHFAIAARTQVALSSRFPRLVRLMKNHALIISHDDDVLEAGEFKGLGSEDFVPLADVPDFLWKPRISKQGHSRPLEGPNHFADMDQPGPDGKTLLELCEDPAFIDPDRWDQFYGSVTDILSGRKIAVEHRGLLPFRVWQIFDAMVGFAAGGDAARFVCAAGVLTHYLGDACQPLHISYLHDGDPNRPVDHTFEKGMHAGETERRPLGQGVHSAYEDGMVFFLREKILAGLTDTPKTAKSELVADGREAAARTIRLMRDTFRKIPPMDIVNAYVALEGTAKERVTALAKKFGNDTVTVMQGGTHLLAVLWESAWAAGTGETNVKAIPTLTPDEAMDIVADAKFLPSMSVDQIGQVLKGLG